MSKSLFCTAAVVVLVAAGPGLSRPADHAEVEKEAEALAKHAVYLHNQLDIHYKADVQMHKGAKGVEAEALHLAKKAHDRAPDAAMAAHVRELHAHLKHLEKHADALPAGQSRTHIHAEVKKARHQIEHLEKHVK